MVSRIYRLSMLIAAKEHKKAADVFDTFMEDLAHIVGPDASGSTEADIGALDGFLERELPSPRSPPVELENTHVVPVRMIIHEDPPVVHVEKVLSPAVASEAEEEETVEAEEEEGEEEAAGEAEETEEQAEEEETVEAEEEGEAVEDTEEAEEETEEGEVASEAEETEEVEEQTEEETEEGEVASEAEEVANEAEETEEVEVAGEATEEVEVTEEADEEETEEAEEEETEEEGSYEPIKIGKSMYFLDTSTQNVFAYVSEEEAGDYVGKLVGGKLVRG